MASSLLETLAAELSKLKSAGHTAIALDPLMTYVEGLVQSAKASDPEGERQRIQIHFEEQLQLEQYRFQVQRMLVMFNAIVEAGQSLLKALSVINGAAAVSILAFLGNVLANPSSEGLATVPVMSRAMIWFAVGVGLAAVGFALRYFSQASFGHDFTADAKKARKWGVEFRTLAIAAAASSLAMFFVGIWLAFNAFHVPNAS